MPRLSNNATDTHPVGEMPVKPVLNTPAVSSQCFTKLCGDLGSVNYHPQPYLWCTKWCHTHQIQCIKTLVGVSQPVSQQVHQKSMCKSHINRRLYQSFGCLIDIQWWSAKQLDHVTSRNQHGGPWEIWIFAFRKSSDSWHLMLPIENSWWPPGRKEINFPY